MNERFSIPHFASFLGFHAVTIAALANAIVHGLEGRVLAIFLVTYLIKTFGVSVVFHRMFSHRSVTSSRPVEFFFALLGTLANQRGPLWWAGHHRVHHAHTDRPEDPHSPVTGGWLWAQLLWVFHHHEIPHAAVRDLARRPELRWLERFHSLPSLVLAIVLYVFAGWSGVAWGYVASTVACWHVSSLINSWGHAREISAQERDASRNRPLLALLMWGEGWHRSHHERPASARFGRSSTEPDHAYWLLCALKWMGILREVKSPYDDELPSKAARNAS